MKAADVNMHRDERRHLFIKLQFHKGYERITPRQKLVIDSFANDLNCEETAQLMGVKKSAPHAMLVRTILPRYKPNIWQQAKNVKEALRLLASEVKL